MRTPDIDRSRWPRLEGALQSSLCDGAVTPVQIGRADLARLADVARSWLPDLGEGFESHLFTAEYLSTRAALRGEDARLSERPLYVVAYEDAGAWVALEVLEHHADERMVSGRMAIVAPDRRGRGVGRMFLPLLVRFGEAVGASVVECATELDNHAVCRLAASSGFHLTAVMPESERRQMPDGTLRQVPECYFVRALATWDEALRPRACDVTPRVAALWALLGEAPLVGAPSQTPAARRSTAVDEPGAVDDTAWPSTTTWDGALRSDPAYHLRALRRGEIPRLVAALRAWAPDLADGRLAHLVDPAHHESAVALAGEARELAARTDHASLLWRGDALAGAVVCTYDPSYASLECLVACVDPSHRGRGLGASLAASPRRLGAAIGAETLLARVDLRDLAGQRTFDAAGWNLWGALPTPRGAALGRDALYGVSRVAPEASRWPDLDALPPARAAFARFVRDQQRVAPEAR